MARIIEGQYGCQVYGEVIDTIRRHGRRTSSRNGVVYDLPDVTISLESPLNALPLGCGRNLNPRIAAAEALQLIGSFSEPDWLCRIAPQFDRYREDVRVSLGCTVDSLTKVERLFHGSYGDRIGDQLESVVSKLRETPDTRQAVVTLWNPERDNEPGHLDYPCTVALNFRRSGRLYRQSDRLDMQVLMRSNDVWLGLPYDMFQFTQLQLTLCNVLDLEPGRYTHTAWSMHLYMTNYDESYSVTDVITPTQVLPHVQGIGNRHLITPNEAYHHTRDRARGLALQNLVDWTVSEAWYLDTLRSFPIDVESDENRDGGGDGEAQPVHP